MRGIGEKEYLIEGGGKTKQLMRGFEGKKRWLMRFRIGNAAREVTYIWYLGQCSHPTEGWFRSGGELNNIASIDTMLLSSKDT